MGQLSPCTSEGNIFTTQRSMEKAAVSEDFSLSLSFAALLPHWFLPFPSSSLYPHPLHQRCSAPWCRPPPPPPTMWSVWENWHVSCFCCLFPHCRMKVHKEFIKKKKLRMKPLRYRASREKNPASFWLMEKTYLAMPLSSVSFLNVDTRENKIWDSGVCC